MLHNSKALPARGRNFHPFRKGWPYHEAHRAMWLRQQMVGRLSPCPSTAHNQPAIGVLPQNEALQVWLLSVVVLSSCSALRCHVKRQFKILLKHKLRFKAIFSSTAKQCASALCENRPRWYRHSLSHLSFLGSFLKMLSLVLFFIIEANNNKPNKNISNSFLGPNWMMKATPAYLLVLI